MVIERLEQYYKSMEDSDTTMLPVYSQSKVLEQQLHICFGKGYGSKFVQPLTQNNDLCNSVR